MKFLIMLILMVVNIFATSLPFQDNLNSADSTCWAARPNSDQNNSGCGEFKSIGLDRYGYPTVSYRPSIGAMQCTYGRIEDECRAQIKFTETDILYTYFELTYSPTYDFGAGQKIMRWSSYNNSAGLNYTDHILYTTSTGLVNGLHNSNMLCAERNGGSQYGCTSFNFVRGQNYKIKTKLKMNNVGSSDGEFTLWINGIAVINKTGLSSLRVASGDNHGFNMTTFGGWYSASSPVAPSTYWIDNPRVSTTDDFAAWESGTLPPVIPIPTPPVVVVPPVVVNPNPSQADTAFSILRDTTRFQVVKRTTLRFITIPAIIKVDTTNILIDTTKIN